MSLQQPTYARYAGPIATGVGLATLCAAPFAAWVAITYGSAEARSSGTPPLFGWQRLVVAHAVTALALAVALAYAAQRHWRQPPSALTILSLALFAVAATGAMALGLAWTAGTLATAAQGYFWRAIARTALCVAVELPWCVGALYVAGPSRQASLRAPLAWGLIAVAVAIGLPSAYALNLCRSATARAEQLLAKQELVAARHIVLRLESAGSERRIAGELPRSVAQRLVSQIHRAQEQLKDCEGRADVASMVAGARLLAMLDRPEEACQRLAPVAPTDPEAALLVAAILQHERRWRESTQWYKAGLDLLAGKPRHGAYDQARVRARDGIAFNAREQGDPAQAEAAYCAGLAEVPEAAAHFHFLLGRHFWAGGRPLSAATHLELASQLDPVGHGEVSRTLLDQISRSSPGCFARSAHRP